MPKLSVAATQPNINGMAPGMAPTKTDSGVFVFRGVYTHVYKKIEIAPNMAVCLLMLYKIIIPNNVKRDAIIKAVLTDIRPEGIGRFLVRSIKASKSFSMIWLKAFDAPTIK